MVLMMIRIRIRLFIVMSIRIWTLHQVLHMLENKNKKTFFHTSFHSCASLHCFIFLVSVTSVIIFTILDIILKFSGNYSLAWYLVAMYNDSDPDWQALDTDPYPATWWRSDRIRSLTDTVYPKSWFTWTVSVLLLTKYFTDYIKLFLFKARIWCQHFGSHRCKCQNQDSRNRKWIYITSKYLDQIKRQSLDPEQNVFLCLHWKRIGTNFKGAQAWPNRVRIFLHKSNLYGLVTWELGKKKYLGWFEPCTALYYPRFLLKRCRLQR
jgi:hypothetical protein